MMKKKERERKKYLWALLVMLCFCLLIIVCPFMPGATAVHAAELHGEGVSLPKGTVTVAVDENARLMEEEVTVYGSATDKGWTLADGTLTISTQAGMDDWANNRSKYNTERSQVTRVTIAGGVTTDGVTTGGVTSIGESAFSYCRNLTSITIPESVKSIGVNAFYECNNLTGITIPESVTSIGTNAFYNCSKLTGITIPGGVESMGTYVFNGCSSLESVTIGNGVKSIGTYMFSGCSALTSITIPSSVTSIGTNAFSGCRNLMSITIPERVTSIGDWVFSGCSKLTSITIPSSVKNIGIALFSGCSSLTNITVETGNTIYDSRDNCNAIIKKEGNVLVAGCEKTVIPDNVESIGSHAFIRCSNLTNITIPSSVTSIGESAFSECINLTSIEIPSRVTSIGKSAFYHCGLTGTVTIPEGVESIEYSAFGSCWRLTGIKIPSTAKSIESNPFGGCSNLTSIVVDPGNTIYNSPSGSNAIIKTEGNILIAGCKQTTIPEGVESIGAGAFYNCGLTGTVTIPESVTSIGANAFWQCSNLTGITIPESVTSIGNWAFYKCGLTGSVTIPEGVESIGEYAFYECSKLTGITIPSSVKSIECSAFRECGLTGNVTIPDGVTSMGMSVFYECSRLESANIPGSVKKLENGVFGKCTNLTSVTIGNGVPIIDQFAFNGCSGLTSITIPGSVEYIGYGAFQDCGLTSVTFEGTTTIPTVETKSFSGCPAVATDEQGIHIPSCEYLSKYLSKSGWWNYKSNISAVHSGLSYAVDAANAAVIQQSCACGGTKYGTANLFLQSGANLIYNGSAITPVQVNCHGEWQGSMPNNGNIIYVENIDVGTATASLEISGATARLNFSITAKPLNDSMIAVADGPHYYTGSGITPTVTVTDTAVGDGKTLEKDTDYTVKYENNTAIGIDTAKVIIEGKGNYRGSIEKTFTITPATMSVSASGYEGTYDGKPHSIDVKVLSPADATVTYSTDGETYGSEIPSFTKAGTHTTVHYKITKGNYAPISGSKTVIINKKPLTITAEEQSVMQGNSIDQTKYTVPVDGMITDDRISEITLTPSTTDITENGTISISGVKIVNASGVDVTENYEITPVAGKLQVTRNTALELTKIEAVKTNTIYTVGDNLNVDDITVTEHYEDGHSEEVTGFTTNVADIDMSKAGEKTLTVSYTKNGEIRTANIIITVNEQQVTDGAWSSVITSGSDGVKIVGYSGSDTAVEVPSVISGNSVTAIGENAFVGHIEITSVTIPVSVTAIDEGAFACCTGLTTVIIPDGLKDLDTTKAGITDTVAKITYTVDETGKITITSVIPGTDSGNKSVTIPDTIGGKKPEISDTVKEKMKNISHDHKGGTATCIQKAVCEICSLEYGNPARHTLAETEGVEPTCTVDGRMACWTCTVCGKMFSDENGTTEVTAEEVKIVALGHDWSGGWVITKEPTATEEGVEETACTHDCGEKKQRIIPATGDGNVFSSVITSDGVKIVGYSGSDKVVKVPSEIDGRPVTAIGENVFAGKTEITSVTIPGSVTTIGENVFAGCTGLTTVIIPNGVATTSAGISDMAAKIIYAVDGNGNITINSVTPGSVTTVEVPSEIGDKPVTAIGEDAFSGCIGLTTITIPDSVTAIGKDAFSGCTGLTTITIPDSVTAIGENAFSGCTGLTSVTIPDSVTTIGEGAFAGCTGLTTIIIPEGVDTTSAGIINTVAKITYKDENGKITITSVTPGTDSDGGKKPLTLPDTIGGQKPEISDTVKEEMKNISHEHKGGTATCIQKAVCEICGVEYGDFAGHTLVKTEGVEPTRTADGRIAYWTCSKCGKKFSDENGTTEITDPTIPATGHESPKSGDDSNPAFWILLMLMSMIALAGLFVKKRKTERQ